MKRVVVVEISVILPITRGRGLLIEPGLTLISRMSSKSPGVSRRLPRVMTSSPTLIWEISDLLREESMTVSWSGL